MPQTLPQMGLTTWNLQGDLYNFAQQAQNLNIINYHDHTAGKGVPIPEGGLAPNSVGPREIAAYSLGIGQLVAPVWHNLTPATNITLEGGAFPIPGACITLDGFVRLKGILINSTGSSLAANSVWATIPAVTGLRPTATAVTLVGSYNNSGTQTVCPIYVNTSGQVYPGVTVANGYGIYLDGMCFSTS